LFEGDRAVAHRQRARKIPPVRGKKEVVKRYVVAHVVESDLALYASGDLHLLRRAAVRLHLGFCERCRAIAESYGEDRERIREIATELPDGVDWNRLSAEMTANIHLGLSAGECVAPKSRRPVVLGWRPAAAMGALAVLVVAGWWLNTPTSTTQALGRAVGAIWHGQGSASGIAEERGMVVEATSAGIEVRENGGRLGVSQGTARPVSVSVSVQGSASARYVNADTGQMTITSVYAQ
jgi:hypothetical protein